jgi:hypothetical protein
MQANYWQLIAVLFSATGFWKLVEILLKIRSGKRKQEAEIGQLQAQAESQIVGNWISWSQKLEARVKELEAVAEENKLLKVQIEAQRRQIGEMDVKIARLQKENQQLIRQLDELSRQTPHA